MNAAGIGQPGTMAHSTTRRSSWATAEAVPKSSDPIVEVGGQGGFDADARTGKRMDLSASDSRQSQ
jgi:hypothetical protein